MERRIEGGHYEDLNDPQTLWDKIVGADEEKRSTKTYLPNERLIAALSILRTHSMRLGKTMARAHNNYFKEQIEAGTIPKLTPLEAVEIYSGIQNYESLHQQVVEHFSSLKGFTLTTMAGTFRAFQDHNDRRGREPRREDADEKSGSSESRWQ